jgi:hypothetical protein
MKKVGNNVIQSRVLEQNPQYKQKSETTYIKNERKLCMYNNNNNNNHGSTALYGPGPPLSEVTWSTHLWQLGDQPT